jgi:methylenetetrahydrofolate dehydrogenase (NADP+) / methenyltetrahydrofolate cyclohydrolase
MALILQGAPVAKAIYEEIRGKVAEHGLQPRLRVFMVGADPASDYYLQNIAKRGEKSGIAVEIQRFPADASPMALSEALEAANDDPAVHAIMVQRPLPKSFDEPALLARIRPEKDVDAVTAANLGRLILDQPGFAPCTAEAVLRVLAHYGISTSGREVVIVGRSAVIGRPLANLLLRRGDSGDATVTVCHTRTPDLSSVARRAEILVAAAGKARMITLDMIREGAVVIDVGVNAVEGSDGSTEYVGDVDYVNVIDRVSAITPVPGGIGSVTTAVLLHHVLESVTRRSQ